MSDDILILDQDYQELKEDPEIQEEIENIIEESKVIDEREEIDKSDIVILASDDINDLRGSQTVDLNSYDKTLLWTNPNPNTSLSGDIDLLDNISDYDLIGFEYKYYGSSTSTNNKTNLSIFTSDYVINSIRATISNTSSQEFPAVLYSEKGTGTSRTTYTRYVTYKSDTKLNTTCSVGNGSVITNIYGYKLNTQSSVDPTPTPTPTPTVSGDIINNYYNYYYSVSDNSVSWNLLNKPLNEYTVTESYFAISTMLALCIGIYLIIRRSIFKWR